MLEYNLDTPVRNLTETATKGGKHRKGGQSYMTVQAGPFNGSGAMQSALNHLRGAGYRDAFAR